MRKSRKEKSRKEGNTCGHTTKGTAGEETGMSHWGKGTGDREEVEKSRGRQSM